MSHGNARLTVHGRVLLVRRVVEDRRPVAHVARELGVSRQCAHRWVNRFRAEGLRGLTDRSSRPRSVPRRTSPERERAVLEARAQLRAGPARLAPVTGVPSRTISRILRRHGAPPLAWLDPVTGAVIRASRSTAHRYEHEHPGDLIHVDVKKLGRIPDGGGWRVHGRSEQVRGRGIGFDYVHAAVDDHTRLAYAEIHPDEKGATAAGFLTRAAAYFAGRGITRIERVITDNAFAYRHSTVFKNAVQDLGARQKFIRPHCPWQNGKVERFNRTLATEWAYRQPFTGNQHRADALDPFIEHYNTERIHSSHGLTPAARVSPTS
ncbi:IS481-like element IS1121 family transposase [Clavibacter sepedonicus]|uniref:Insertion element IS1121 transposase n=3 Tax=Clavibacter sepedonicus TaxID=31964 RepID=B0RER0_CLASE|nr:IS481-like element IS1121 family transposase [Clavibacter sepedonicus]OQJ49271.1 IS481 family transposase [Clavibacter sepedonicus]OQJ49394.1 IS481 family transposase [Clavibacter sepedonicus]OQJ54885.1 IS481 family transposase [Clavibacter sepedonicus]UUK64887.1 IS481-like element IS1121 family transposase [Clavibacter sepedonicus]CAQ00907.1 putative insertion element IS1121 transposase [Clavibacter sepedonicus]